MDRERIGKYQILGKLGQGTMGEVFRALDPALRREVALKTVSLGVAPEDESLQRFQREAQAAALLNHPNIVTVHDYGQEDGILYMAMELLEGEDLRSAIDKDQMRTLDQKLDVMEGVLDALDYAHERGVVHRDIKPANIHLGPGSPGHQVKIMDFGLARVHTSDMTQDGIVLGTPNYMSPEQAMGDKVDGRSDLFAAGAVLYELLTSHKPFEADSTPSVLFQVVHRQPPPVKRWAPDVPTPLVEVVNRALTKERDHRYASAKEMRAALGAARRAAQSAPELRPPKLPPDQSTSARQTAQLPSTSQRRRPPGSSPGMRGRRAQRRRATGLPALGLGAGLALIVVLFLAGTWLRDRIWPPAAPADNTAQVGELTRALVATQTQLAQRELNDKNWTAAVAQAESALRLDPEQPEAREILDTAHRRLDELNAAIAATRRELAAENTEAASGQLSRLLELDPRHPAATELSARLNTVFHSQADQAAASSRAARDAARTAGAAPSPEFRAADAASARAEELVASEEFADATRTFLEARDGYDRAGRAARERQAAAPGTPDVPAPTRPTPTPTARAAQPPSPSPRAAPTPTPARATPSQPAPTPVVPARHFVGGSTTVTTPSAGELAGFESTDVTTRKPPTFVGRMEFEVLPAEVRPGEPFVVRVHLVNEGRRGVRIEGIEITTVADGRRSAASARVLQQQVPARGRALVAEHSGVWAPARIWSLTAEAALEGDERVRSRLRSE